MHDVQLINYENGRPPSLVELEAVLAAANADGRGGAKGRQALEKLAEVRAALAEGDRSKAEQKLREVRQKLREGQREGKIEPSLAQQALELVDSIAATYGLELPGTKNP